MELSNNNRAIYLRFLHGLQQETERIDNTLTSAKANVQQNMGFTLFMSLGDVRERCKLMARLTEEAMREVRELEYKADLLQLQPDKPPIKPK